MGRAKKKVQGECSSGRQAPERYGRPEVGEQSSLFGLLSDDIILHILRNVHTRFLLSSPALVCRRWSRLCCSHLVLEIVPSPLSAYNLPWRSLGDAEMMDLVMLNVSTLEHLQISRLKKSMLDKVVSLVKTLPRLQRLGIISCSLTESNLEDIVNALPAQLTSLDLHNDHLLTGSCEEAYQNMSKPALTTFLRELPKRCPNLNYLDLDFCNYFGIDCLDSFLLLIPHIRSLHLQSDTFGWLEVSKILRSCSLLESISLVSIHLFEEQDSSDEEEGTFFMGKKLKNWHRMPLAKSKDADLRSLVCTRLKSIRFYSSPHRSVPLDSTPVFGLLKEKGQQLCHLHAQSVYNTSWHTISVWCANLQTLDLSHAQALPYSATEVEEVVLSGLIRRMKGLEKLGLPSVSDRVLIEIGRSCPNMKELHFQGHASASGLTHTRTKVTDLGVVGIAEGCPNLQVISLRGCVCITVASLRALAFHCKHVKALLLPGCVKVNDDAIATIWPSIGKSLLVLDLVGCKITSKTIGLFLQHGKVQWMSLVLLSISRSLCNSAKAELSRLSKGLPSLHVSRSMSGLPWDGFFGACCLDDLIPQRRMVDQNA